MVIRFLLLLFAVAASVSPAHAQAPESEMGTSLVNRLQESLTDGSSTIPPELLLAPADVVERFAASFFAPGTTRAVAQIRDRSPLEGALPGDGFSLIVDFFSEIGDHARIVTARLDVRRPRDGDDRSWRIVGLEQLSLVEGLYRLHLDVTTQYAARNFSIQSEDLELILAEGSVFHINSDEGVTGLVMVGRGTMRFAPAPPVEKGQVRIFSGSETLVTAFETAFVRLNPGDYLADRDPATLVTTALDSRAVRRAEEVFEREAPKSFSIDLREVSPDQWFLVPPPGDFISEVRTRRMGTLTYARNQNQPEDVTLFNRERRRTIALYASQAKLRSQGPTYNEDELSDVDVTAYDIEARIDPARQSIVARARMTIEVRAPYVSTLTLRLADTLEVTNVASLQFGRLLNLRVRNQNALLVSLPTALAAGTELTLIVSYRGQLEPQQLDAEVLALQQNPDDFLIFAPEPKYLLSNRAYWYPQNGVSDYATARLRVGLPEGWGCVATGQPADSVGDISLRDLLGPIGTGPSFTFIAAEPVRYLSIIASRLTRVADGISVAVGGTPNDSGQAAADAAELPQDSPLRTTLALRVDANPRLVGRGRDVAQTAADILGFYGQLMGDLPYPSMSIAVVEDDLPGGHSPAYATMLNSPSPAAPILWRNDPAAFTNFPEFFLAHELAHQWWGQAVGWKNYHEQWISEGFAQYFAALYAQRVRGDGVFGDMLRQFRRWAIAESDQGPIYLGYRLGHVKGETRIFRALVYNKSASVLHMLRRLVGDEAFFRGLRRFYSEQKFRKAGSEEFARAMEAESGLSLERFFERWIFGSTVPRLRYATEITNGEVVVRFEQLGAEIFDVPVTVTLTFADGRTRDVVVPVTEQRAERRIPVESAVRQVQINRDFAALAEFDGS